MPATFSNTPLFARRAFAGSKLTEAEPQGKLASSDRPFALFVKPPTERLGEHPPKGGHETPGGNPAPPVAQARFNEQRAERPPLVVPLPPAKVERARFELLQQWEGTVTEVGEGEFTAKICDLTDPSRPDEIVSLASDEVSAGDLPLLKPGAVFYWSIGYETELGQKRRVSALRFRRLPAWSRKAVEEVARDAAELKRLFG
jgi:hypothetical protein